MCVRIDELAGLKSRCLGEEKVSASWLMVDSAVD